jgi:hypothetical protein
MSQKSEISADRAAVIVTYFDSLRTDAKARTRKLYMDLNGRMYPTPAMDRDGTWLYEADDNGRPVLISSAHRRRAGRVHRRIGWRPQVTRAPR